MSGAVLLLNQNYEPLHVCRTRRAVGLLIKGKAEAIVQHEQGIRSPRQIFPRPAVIRMLYHVRRPRPQVKLSRREVFVRDDHTCQYCGANGSNLTVDHVIPRRMGGKRRWENLVTACLHCNLRKAGRTPREANMRLHRPPRRPRSAMYHTIFQMTSGRMDPTWAPYVNGHWRRRA